MRVVVVLDGLGEAMTRLLNLAKKGLWASVVGIVLYVGAMAYLSPETSTYTSNADVPARPTTTHRFTPTTTARASSAVSAEKVLDEIVIIDGDEVTRLPRSPAVMLALYIFMERLR